MFCEVFLANMLANNYPADTEQISHQLFQTAFLPFSAGQVV